MILNHKFYYIYLFYNQNINSIKYPSQRVSINYYYKYKMNSYYS